MKEILMMIRPGKYFETKQALSDHRFFAMSTKEVLGRGKKPVKFTSAEDGKAYDAVYEDALVAKKMIDMVVRDEDADEVIRIVMDVNQGHREGDGKIFVLPVENSYRIHTDESGDDALL
ncbi:MAG: P-II family nitrogen regulator [Lachnospiraceae bacterium]